MTLKYVQTPEQEVVILKSRPEKQDAELHELRQQLSRATIFNGATARYGPRSPTTHPYGRSRNQQASAKAASNLSVVD